MSKRLGLFCISHELSSSVICDGYVKVNKGKYHLKFPLQTTD